MSEMLYNKRTWLNGYDSHYTGSIVCVDVKDLVNRGKHMDSYSFVEISDCNGKVRIHNDLNHGIDSYIEKLRTIQTELALYINHLEQEYANGGK